MRAFFAVLIFLYTPVYAAEQSNDVQSYARFDQITDLKISPDGSYISGRSNENDQNKLIIFDRKTMKILHKLKFRGKMRSEVGQYHWISKTRIALEQHYLPGYLDKPIRLGVFHGVNYDGRYNEVIFGERDPLWHDTRAFDRQLLAPLTSDDRYALFSAQKYDGYHYVYRVNTNRGWAKELTKVPLSHSYFVLDAEQNIRFATGLDKDLKMKSYMLEDEEWVDVATLNISDRFFKPLALKPNSGSVYALYSPDGGPKGLYLFNLKTGEQEAVFRHHSVSIDQVKKDRHGKLYAITYDYGTPATVIIDKQNGDARALRKLMKRFPGHHFEFVSQTEGGNLKLVYSHNQYNPGEYLLYDVKKDSLKHLISKRPWYDPSDSATVEPFFYKSRDGLEILAYVTLPLGVESLDKASKLPFVLKVHNGVHNNRDRMEYDSENQLFASRGIGVLQVNYRGSSGFGQHFREKGFMHWQDKIQYDLIDGIAALVDKGIADKNRLCILGAGIGGYSAVQSAIIEPDLFKCAIGKYGYYDLTLMHHSELRYSKAAFDLALDSAISNNKEDLIAASPAYHTDKLKTPLLIIHGGKDKIAILDHALRLKQNLDKNGKEYEWLLLDSVGHGIYKPEHQEQTFNRTLSFLQKHLGLTSG